MRCFLETNLYKYDKSEVKSQKEKFLNLKSHIHFLGIVYCRNLLKFNGVKDLFSSKAFPFIVVMYVLWQKAHSLKGTIRGY